MERDMSDDWSQIDVKKVAEPEVDFEIDEEVRAEEAAAKAPLEIEEEADNTIEVDPAAPDPAASVPELAGVDTEGAQKRIRQLVRQRKEREEHIIAQQQQIAQLQSHLRNTEEKNVEVFRKNYDVTERQLQEKAELARQTYLRAYDDGDKEAMLSAQEAMFDARQNIGLVRQGRQEVDRYATDLANQPVHANNIPQQSAPVYDEKAVEWAEKNSWFGQDQVATAAALALDATLKNEGYDPSTDDFYREVDRRLRAELPNKFQGKAAAPVKQPQQQQVVGGQSRGSPESTAKGGNRKVKLTRDDIALAKKWNIPLERYAKEKAKAENASAVGDYTSIQVG
jgi:hypothetical protein